MLAVKPFVPDFLESHAHLQKRFQPSGDDALLEITLLPSRERGSVKLDGAFRVCWHGPRIAKLPLVARWDRRLCHDARSDPEGTPALMG
jgi:hypothetical protein